VAAPRVCFAQLKPLSEREAQRGPGDRPHSQGELRTFPGAALYLQAVQDLTVGGRFGGAQYQYTLQADNLSDLSHWAPIIQQRIAKIPELRDVNSDQQMRGLASNIVIDPRYRPARLGVNLMDIDKHARRTLSASARSPTSTRVSNQYHGRDGSCPARTTKPRRA